MDLTGEYYLRGIPELASGFKLDKDNRFEFFMIYGALDRHGSGTWKQDKNQVIFNSKTWSGKDFALLKSKKNNDDKITIRIVDNNTQVLRYMLASLGTEREGEWLAADSDGIITFPRSAVKSISLAFEFCPERFSIFSIENSGDNYFEFRLEPWLVEFFFKDFKLTITEEGLKGRHPAMEGAEFTYVKSS